MIVQQGLKLLLIKLQILNENKNSRSKHEIDNGIVFSKFLNFNKNPIQCWFCLNSVQFVYMMHICLQFTLIYLMMIYLFISWKRILASCLLVMLLFYVKLIRRQTKCRTPCFLLLILLVRSFVVLVYRFIFKKSSQYIYIHSWFFKWNNIIHNHWDFTSK